MVWRVWLIAATLGFGCVVRGPGYLRIGVPREQGTVAVCRNPAATLVELHNPGPATVVVGRTLVPPGARLVCVPPGAAGLVAVQVWQRAAGQPLTPVLTDGGRAAIGYRIDVVARGRRSVTAMLDPRYPVRLPLRSTASPYRPPPQVEVGRSLPPPIRAPLRPAPPPLATSPPTRPPAVPERPDVDERPVPPDDEIDDAGWAASIDVEPPVQPEQPAPPEPPPPPRPSLAVEAGRYRIISVVDLAGAQTLGAPISNLLIKLSEFRTHPTPVLLEVLFLKYSKLRKAWDLLSTEHQQDVTDFIDKIICVAFDQVDDVGQLATFIGEIGNVSRTIGLETEISLTASSNGTVLRGDHVPTRVGLRFQGHALWIAVPDGIRQITRREVLANLTALPESRGGPRGILAINQQNFAIRYGDIIFQAMTESAFRRADTRDLGGWLNNVIDCGDIADRLYHSRYTYGLEHVYNQARFQKLCSSALEDLGSHVEGWIRELQIELVDLGTGHCDVQAGDGDALSNCSWDMTLRIHGASNHVNAHFEIERM